VNFLDEFGLSASDAKVKISMSSIYDKSSQKITSTIIPQKADGSVDYINIRTYAFNASNNVRNEINGQRTIPDIKTIPANKETPEYYYPRTFPNGTFDVGKSQPVSASNPNAKYLGEVFIPTTATQLVPTYGTKNQSQIVMVTMYLLILKMTVRMVYIIVLVKLKVALLLVLKSKRMVLQIYQIRR